MNISLTIDDSALRQRLGRLSDKGLTFATVDAIRNVALLVQKVEREDLHKGFTLRTETSMRFLERRVAVIKPFPSASQGRPFADISVGEANRLLLAQFEAGGVKKPAYGKKGVVAVPVTGSPARPTFKQPVPKTLFLRSLRIKARKTKAGKVQLKGLDRTFLLKQTAKHPKGGVFKRVGPGRDDIRMIYSFKPNPKLSRLLHFRQTAERVGNLYLKAEFEAQIAKQIAKGRTR